MEIAMELTTVDPQRAILCAAIALLVGAACYLWRHRRKYFVK